MTENPAHKIEDKIQEMQRRIVALFDPEKIVLFGSYARGGAGTDSDVDLLVVLRDVTARREKRLDIRTALHGVGVAKDIVVASPDEMERYRDVVGTIIRPALLHGKVLYERPG
jgi:uncharacterized protein